MPRVGRMISVLAFLAAIVVGLLATTEAPARPPVCPQIWAPVICDNDRIYPNQCEADRHHAQNCVPYDGI